MTSAISTDPHTRVLVIDDDLKLCRLVRDYLEPMGFDITAAHNGLVGLQFALSGDFDALILDLMLPGLNGLEVLRRLRTQSNIPVLMLTGRGEEPDRIVGLELGADDYLPKTFSTRELLARLRAVVRRSKTAARENPRLLEDSISVGDLTVDSGSRSARIGSETLQLTAVEFDLLYSLASSAGRVKTREQLLQEVAERDFDVFDRSIDVHISSLRRKLGDDPKAPRFIVTIRSAGYMMRRPDGEAAA